MAERSVIHFAHLVTQPRRRRGSAVQRHLGAGGLPEITQVRRFFPEFS
jgi:hypothetical protein